MKVYILSIVVLSLAACTSGDTSLPTPNPPYGAGCRCTGLVYHLALVRVEDTPVPFRDDMQPLPGLTGMEFHVIVEQLLPVTRDLYHIASPPAVSSSILARQYLLDRNGAPLRNALPGEPATAHVGRGQRLLVELTGARPAEPTVWSVSLLASDPTTGALTRPWYEFPTGTPASQVLDPTEWNTISRGCAACTISDAGADAPDAE